MQKERRTSDVIEKKILDFLKALGEVRNHLDKTEMNKTRKGSNKV